MKSFLTYFGGKSRLASTIVERIPAHQCYCEVFAGAAWVLFTKPEETSKSEIINDVNSELVNLYRVVQLHLEEFVRFLKWIVVARDEFDRFKREDPRNLTDIQRAVRYYYLLRMGYGSKVKSHHFASAPSSRPSLNLLRIEEDLSAAHMRLARVYIQNLPYETLIRRHDRPSTFFYLDPPYHGFEDDYGKGVFGEEDFGRLRDILASIEGRFIMSINDTPFIRDMFAQFQIEPVRTRWSTSPAKKEVAELLISTRPPHALSK
jgi:DNA adenine methylase